MHCGGAQLSEDMEMRLSYQVRPTTGLLVLDTDMIRIPIATPAFIVLLAVIATNFPDHGHPDVPYRRTGSPEPAIPQKLTFAGAALLSLANLSLTTAFDISGSRFSRVSTYVITFIVVSGVLLVALILFGRLMTHYAPSMEPVPPRSSFGNRTMVSLMLQVMASTIWRVKI